MNQLDNPYRKDPHLHEHGVSVSVKRIMSHKCVSIFNAETRTAAKI
jgi:hypothetical protein